jgi:hypothetical protein
MGGIMKRMIGTMLVLGLASCATTGEEATIVKKPHVRVARAGILPSREIPAERDGIPADATGAIMFVCSGSDKHKDKEVLISKCPSCSENNYFYWDTQNLQFVCFACTKAVDNAIVKCPDCGRPPHKVHTRPTGK